MIKVIFLTLLAFLAFGNALADVVITSLPYSLPSSDETYILNGDLASATDGIFIRSGRTNITIDLNGHTLNFGTGNGSNYGIRFELADHIRIINGTIYHAGSGANNVCADIRKSHDLYFENVNMRVAGLDGHCFDCPSVACPGNYNIEINGGNFVSDVTSYTSRHQYTGAVMRLDRACVAGDFGFKVHGITLSGHSQGILLSAHGGEYPVFEMYDCYLISDARNDISSSANPYLILVTRAGPGTAIYNNTIRSGNEYGGSRGIILEMCKGTSTMPIEVYGNDVDIHEGPNLESSRGLCQALRVRYGNSYVNIHNNTFRTTGDSNPATTAYGIMLAPMRFTATDEEGHTPDHHIVFKDNIFEAVALDAGTEAVAAMLETFPDLEGNIIEGNTFISSNNVINFGDRNYGGHDNILKNNVFRIPEENNHSPVVFTVGWSNWFDAYGNEIIDGRFEGIASESMINVVAPGDIALKKTLEFHINNDENQPVAGATITVADRYGNLLLRLTNNAGFADAIVPYLFKWQTSETNYNPYNITAFKDIDTTYLSVDVNSETEPFYFTLGDSVEPPPPPPPETEVEISMIPYLIFYKGEIKNISDVDTAVVDIIVENGVEFHGLVLKPGQSMKTQVGQNINPGDLVKAYCKAHETGILLDSTWVKISGE